MLCEAIVLYIQCIYCISYCNVAYNHTLATTLSAQVILVCFPMKQEELSPSLVSQDFLFILMVWVMAAHIIA